VAAANVMRPRAGRRGAASLSWTSHLLDVGEELPRSPAVLNDCRRPGRAGSRVTRPG
jgi:hypothetical protein